MPKHRCAVVIPTKNAIAILPRVMAKVLSQKTPWTYEIIVIDSGSSDGTAEYLRGLEQVRLIEIAPEEFGHGKTRNLGIEAADADFAAFITHDAEPTDEHWLQHLVLAAERDARIAGVFGRHLAYESASPFTKRDLSLHFDGFLNQPLIVYKDLDAQRYETDLGWRQFLHFYSDNNSLMRKSVWENFPYPDVEFAEDQLWAKEIIEAGYWKAYSPEATVFHSHDYTFIEQLKRAFDESRNFSKYFGYKLSASPARACAAILKSTVKALGESVEERYGPATFGNRLERAAQRIATITGHCLGANHEKLPECIAQRLSLDYRLFKA